MCPAPGPPGKREPSEGARTTGGGPSTVGRGLRMLPPAPGTGYRAPGTGYRAPGTCRALAASGQARLSSARFGSVGVCRCRGYRALQHRRDREEKAGRGASFPALSFLVPIPVVLLLWAVTGPVPSRDAINPFALMNARLSCRDGGSALLCPTLTVPGCSAVAEVGLEGEVLSGT